MESIQHHPSNPSIVFSVYAGRWYGKHVDGREWRYLGKLYSIDGALRKYLELINPKTTQTFHVEGFIELSTTNGYWYGRLTDTSPPLREFFDKRVDVEHCVRRRRRLGKGLTFDEALAKYRQFLGLTEPPEVDIPSLAASPAEPPEVDVPSLAVNRPKQQRHYERRNGVYEQPSGKFVASVQKHGKRFYLGSFDTSEEAYRAVATCKPLIMKETMYSKEAEKTLRDMVRMGRKKDVRVVKKPKAADAHQLAPSTEGESRDAAEPGEPSITRDDPMLSWMSDDEVNALIAM